MMTRMSIAMMLAAVLCGPRSAQAQTPDFSGRWVLDPAQSLVNGRPRPLTGRGAGAARVGGTIKAPTKVKDVRPVYPADAQRNRIAGTVIIEARLDPNGRVSNAEVVASIPALDQAALDAVSQWEFTPTLLDGEAVPVIMTVTVSFRLDGRTTTPAIPVRPTSVGGQRAPSTSPPGTAAPGQPVSGSTSRVTITQDAESMTVSNDPTWGPSPTVAVYRFDGSETRNFITRPAPRDSGATVEVEWICRSRWDNGRLVTTITPASTQPYEGGFRPRTETRYREGDTMVVETASPGPTPEAKPLLMKMVYKKAGL
jgi:TonB family protein